MVDGHDLHHGDPLVAVGRNGRTHEIEQYLPAIGVLQQVGGEFGGHEFRGGDPVLGEPGTAGRGPGSRPGTAYAGRVVHRHLPDARHQGASRGRGGPEIQDVTVTVVPLPRLLSMENSWTRRRDPPSPIPSP